MIKKRKDINNSITEKKIKITKITIMLQLCIKS